MTWGWKMLKVKIWQIYRTWLISLHIFLAVFQLSSRRDAWINQTSQINSSSRGCESFRFFHCMISKNYRGPPKQTSKVDPAPWALQRWVVICRPHGQQKAAPFDVGSWEKICTSGESGFKSPPQILHRKLCQIVDLHEWLHGDAPWVYNSTTNNHRSSLALEISLAPKILLEQPFRMHERWRLSSLMSNGS
jgi:hypothetical protein